MFGEYLIIKKNGQIDTSKILNEEEVIKRLQGNRNKNFDFEETVRSNDLFGKKLDMYLGIKKYVENIIKKNIMYKEIKTSTIFYKNERLKKLQSLFGLNLFECSNNLILRPATDFGVFSLLQDSLIEISELPIVYYEIGDCYRLEKEFDGSLIKSYSFEMPDMHVIAKYNFYDIVSKHLMLYKCILDYYEFNYAFALRITQREYDIYFDKLKKISETLNLDLFVNIIPFTIRYWEAKFKFVRINDRNTQVQLSTVQVDYISSEIFNFKSTELKNLIVVHSSPGSIQRLLSSRLGE